MFPLNAKASNKGLCYRLVLMQVGPWRGGLHGGQDREPVRNLPVMRPFRAGVDMATCWLTVNIRMGGHIHADKTVGSSRAKALVQIRLWLVVFAVTLPLASAG